MRTLACVGSWQMSWHCRLIYGFGRADGAALTSFRGAI
jgi:hypothetical protein